MGKPEPKWLRLYLENDHRRIMAELSETSKKLQNKEEVEDTIREATKLSETAWCALGDVHRRAHPSIAAD